MNKTTKFAWINTIGVGILSEIDPCENCEKTNPKVELFPFTSTHQIIVRYGIVNDGDELVFTQAEKSSAKVAFISIISDDTISEQYDSIDNLLNDINLPYMINTTVDLNNIDVETAVHGFEAIYMWYLYEDAAQKIMNIIHPDNLASYMMECLFKNENIVGDPQTAEMCNE